MLHGTDLHCGHVTAIALQNFLVNLFGLGVLLQLRERRRLNY